MSTPVTADSVYELIKSFEGQFPIPAPYVSVNVGTFDPATGTFTGLTTEVTFDPAPITARRCRTSSPASPRPGISSPGSA